MWWQVEDNGNGKAVISDDMQMTLFTACGLLNAKKNGIALKTSICRAYIEWLLTQTGKKKKGYPQFFKDDLELHDVILHVADDLYEDKTTKYV